MAEGGMQGRGARRAAGGRRAGVSRALLATALVGGFLWLGAVACLVARRIQTARHETALAEPAEVTLGDGAAASLTGCFAEFAGPGTLRLRAVSPLPVVRLRSLSGRPSRVDLRLENLAADKVRVAGRDAPAIGGDGVLAAPIDLPAGGSREVRIEPSARPGKFSFFVVGDSQGRYDVLKRVFADASAERPLFVFNLGDLAAFNSAEEIEAHRDFSRKCPVPYFTAIGDHDLLRPGLRGEGYVKRFGPTYYRFAFGNSCFVVLDNSAGYVSRGQVDWLRASLRSMAAYPNKFVLAHQPPFDPRRGERHAMKPLIAGAEVVMSLAAKARVAAFFAGHIHSFVETRRGGVPYVITGGGGGDLKAPFPRYHYVAVTVDGDEARWRVRLVEP